MGPILKVVGNGVILVAYRIEGLYQRAIRSTEECGAKRPHKRQDLTKHGF